MASDPPPPKSPDEERGYDVETVDLLPLGEPGALSPLTRAYVPRHAGSSQSYPCLVFSHGTGGGIQSYAYLGEFLAAHGIVCLHPLHLGSDASILKGQRYSLNRELIWRACIDETNWRQRPQEVRRLLNAVSAIEEQLALRLDRDRLAMAGHSLGAITTLLLAGAEVPLGSE